MIEIVKRSPGLTIEAIGATSMLLAGLPLTFAHDAISGIGFICAGLVMTAMGFVSVALGH